MVSFYDYLQVLAPKVTDELVVANIAGVSKDWHHLKDRDGNLYQVYMAGVTPIALGIALALPHRRVISLDSDGSMLMGLTILPVVAQQNPSNLIIIICDNERYEATNKLPTFTAGVTDLAGIAREAGIRNVRLVREKSEFQTAVDEAFEGNGTSFIVAKVQLGHRPVPYTILRGAENKYRFIRYIENTEHIQVIRPPVIKP